MGRNECEKCGHHIVECICERAINALSHEFDQMKAGRLRDQARQLICEAEKIEADIKRSKEFNLLVRSYKKDDAG